jgi:RNA polymerase sigma-70 factor, ECF subfamily
MMLRLAQGERDAPLEVLYDRHAAALYGLGVRLLRDRQLAEDMVQETFVRLWRGARRYDPKQATVRTLLFVIARRVAIDLHRRPGSRPLTLVPDEDLDGQDGLLSSDERAERVVLAIGVREAMAELSDAHREVLELHFDAGLIQRDIAERLGIPLGTVKTRTYHALRALRTLLEQGDLVD